MCRENKLSRTQITNETFRTRLVTHYQRALLILAMGVLLNACGGGGDVPSDVPSAVACITGPSPALLTWDPVSDPNLAGYHVYYGTTGGPYPQQPLDVAPNAATATVTGLSSGTTYYFVVTAYDTSIPPNESNFSNAVCKTIP